MWTTKYFKTYQAAIKWIESNKHKYQCDIVYINNGYGVEYRPLRIIDIQ
jgi:hypothetical protein